MPLGRKCNQVNVFDLAIAADQAMQAYRKRLTRCYVFGPLGCAALSGTSYSPSNFSDAPQEHVALKFHGSYPTFLCPWQPGNISHCTRA